MLNRNRGGRTWGPTLRSDSSSELASSLPWAWAMRAPWTMLPTWTADGVTSERTDKIQHLLREHWSNTINWKIAEQISKRERSQFVLIDRVIEDSFEINLLLLLRGCIMYFALVYIINLPSYLKKSPNTQLAMYYWSNYVCTLDFM